MPDRPPLRVGPTRLVVVAVTTALVLGVAACDSGPVGELAFSGPAGAVLNAADLGDLRFEVRATERLTVGDIVVRIGDDEVAELERSDQLLSWTPGALEDGEYTVTVLRTRGDEEPETLHVWSFTVDGTAPEIEIIEPSVAVVEGEPFVVAGTTEPGATVEVAGEKAEADDEGSFELEVPEARAGTLAVEVTDAAGNAVEDELEVRTVPSRVAVDAVRGLHMTQHAWVYPPKRDRVLDMIDAGKANTIVLTLKDESGHIGYDSQIPRALEIGSSKGVVTLSEAVADMHARGIHVIGRIVAFRDPILGGWAESNGRGDMLVRTPSGAPYTGKYPCCFMNFTHPEVTDYNLAIAEEAARAGVDVILWDYIRRPDGPLDNLVFAGMEGTPEQGIIDFVERANALLTPWGTGHGVSVYGISGTRPTQTAQNIPGMVPHVDIISPMLYPSHWGRGEYDVADPNRQPYDIIYRSLEEFLQAVEGTDTRIVPWLEDSAYRAWNRPTQIREQQRGAAERGVHEWMMWDPSVMYTPDAYATAAAGDDAGENGGEEDGA